MEEGEGSGGVTSSTHYCTLPDPLFDAALGVKTVLPQ